MPSETTDAGRKRRDLSPDELRRLYEVTGVEPTIATAEAAPLLGVEPQTLRRWACKGDGPIRPTRVNGRLRWSVAEIKAVLSNS